MYLLVTKYRETHPANTYKNKIRIKHTLSSSLPPVYVHCLCFSIGMFTTRIVAAFLPSWQAERHLRAASAWGMNEFK